MAGVVGIHTADELVPKASSHPNIVWSGMTASTQQGPAELRLCQAHPAACTVLGRELGVLPELSQPTDSVVALLEELRP